MIIIRQQLKSCDILHDININFMIKTKYFRLFFFFFYNCLDMEKYFKILNIIVFLQFIFPNYNLYDKSLFILDTTKSKINK